MADGLVDKERDHGTNRSRARVDLCEDRDEGIEQAYWNTAIATLWYRNRLRGREVDWARVFLTTASLAPASRTCTAAAGCVSDAEPRECSDSAASPRVFSRPA